MEGLIADGLVAGVLDIKASLKAARATAGKLPIVMVAVDYDPIARGHVASLNS